MRIRFFSLLLASSFVGTSCVAPLSVDEVPPPRPQSVAVDAATLKKASRKHGDPLISAGVALDALRIASDRIEKGDSSAVPEYNYLLGRLAEHLTRAAVQPWQNEVEIPSLRTKYVVRGSMPEDLRDTKRVFVPVDRMEFSGRYASDAGSQVGVGAPLVGFVEVSEEERYEYADEVRYRDVTAVIRFEGDRAVIDLVDPYQTDIVKIGSTRYALAANFGAGVSYALSKERIDKLGLVRLFFPGQYNDTMHLGRFQPYDPDRIPVVMVHGLLDTPATWAPMYFELISDPEIRRRYQFWGFSYPSGYPYPIPADELRKGLARMRGHYPDHKDMVFIGHSMGGLVTRLMVTDVGDKIWRDYFGTSPAETDIQSETRDLVEGALVFNAQDDVSRALFFSAPHRGANMAENRIGRFGSRLVQLPNSFAKMRDNFVSAIKRDDLARKIGKAPNSIDTLSPDNSFVQAINKFPIEQGIPYHTVAGDRGKNVPKEESSDGVVAYWSSHLDGAESELIIPSHHGTHQHPEGIEEARRILYLHAGIPYTAPKALRPKKKQEINVLEDRRHFR